MRIEQNGDVKITIVATSEGEVVEAFMQTERVVLDDGEITSRGFEGAGAMVNPTALPEALREVVSGILRVGSLEVANAELEARVAFLEAQAAAEVEAGL